MYHSEMQEKNFDDQIWQRRSPYSERKGRNRERSKRRQAVDLKAGRENPDAFVF